MLFCLVAPRTQAYSVTGYSWPGTTVTLHLQLGSATSPLQDGFDSWGASAEDALGTWNTHIARLRFVAERDSTASRGGNNRINNVVFSADVYGQTWGAGVLAVTITYHLGPTTIETDVLFNNRLSWDSYRGALRTSGGATVYDFHRVALHEFGHVLGLDHPDEKGQNVTALMNSRISSLDALAADDIAGAQSLYGTSSTASPPVITSQPTSRAVNVGQSTSFTVGVSSNLAVTYQWLKNGAAINGATTATLAFSSAATTDAGSYSVTVANSAGSVTSDTATLTVGSSPTMPTAIAPFITSHPSDAIAIAGASATFAVVASGTAPLTYQWFKDGANVAGATSARLLIAAASASDAGSYVVLVTNSAGMATSTAARLTVIDVPVITSAPTAQTIVAGARAAFSVVATSSMPMTYQWLKDDAEIAAATTATLVFDAAGPGDAGSYSVRVSNAHGSVTSTAAMLTVQFSRLVNIATRGYVPEGGMLVTGFHVRGTGTKPILVRAAGPALLRFGLGGALSDPGLEVIAQDTGALVASNQGWDGNSALRNAFASVGAFPFGSESKDAALLATLAARGYTARVTSVDPALAGIVLAEVYDGDGASVWSTRILNLSTLGFVGAGDTALTIGVVIGGNVAKRVLLRAIGPGLAAFGVPDLLPDPQFVLQRADDGSLLASNDDWPDTSDMQAAFRSAGAFALTRGSKDSALLIALNPGAYTITISGAYGMMGNSLVELYDLDP